MGASQIAPGPSAPAIANENEWRTPRFAHLCRHVHTLGPRPIGEVLISLVGQMRAERALERYAHLTPGTVEAVGARDFPQFQLTEK